MEQFLHEYFSGSIWPNLNMAVGSINNDTSNTNGDYFWNEALNRTATALIEHVSQNHKNGARVSRGDSGESVERNVFLDGTNDSAENVFFIQPQQQYLVDVFGSGGDNVNAEYAEYLSNDSSSPATAQMSTSRTASPALHLLDSWATVTTTTVSSMAHQLTDQLDNELGFSCDGESQTLSALNFSLAAGNGSLSMDSADDDEALSSVYFKTAVYLLYIPIFVFALLGNGTVCYIVQSTPRMRTVTNYFIVNLAVGDILMSLFCVPSSFISIFILGYWPFGIALCHLVNYSQAVSVLVSAYTLVAISIDRYIAIMWPLRPRITKRYAKFIIAGIWIIALATAFPIPIVSKLVQPGKWHVYCERYVCQEEWASKEQNYYYTWALLTLQFLVPLSVLIFTYTRIALAVWGKRPPGEAENSRDQRMARSKRKMIKMMVTVVIVFTMCWLPFNILILLLNDDVLLAWGPLPYFWFAFHWLAMSHSCYNPIIYCYMNARFRGGFLQIIYRVPGLRRCCCLRRYLHTRGDRSYEATGMDDAFHLQRVNTCTTFISTRRKMGTNSMHASQSSCAETTVLR